MIDENVGRTFCLGTSTVNFPLRGVPSIEQVRTTWRIPRSVHKGRSELFSRYVTVDSSTFNKVNLLFQNAQSIKLALI